MIGNLLFLMGVLLALGAIVGKITHALKLTGVVGYLIVGMVLGPITKSFGYFGVSESTLFTLWEITTKTTLALVAFIIGGHLRIKMFKQLGRSIIAIIFGESFGAFFLVLVLAYLVSGNLALSLLLASLAPASAPAGTVAVLHEYRARGPLTNALLAVVGWDDALAILIFACALSAIKISLGGALTIFSVMEPLREIIGALILGTALAVALLFLTRRIQDRESLLVVSLTCIFIGAGLAEGVGFSLILTCMVLGMLSINLAPSFARTSLKMIENLMPPVYIVFFALAGTQLRFDLLATMGLLGVTYIVGRALGLISGASISARLSGASPVLQRYLGFGILSQAGVAIGLAALAASELVGTPVATQSLTLIMATTVVFEIIGPIGVRYALTKAGEAREK